MSPYWLYLVQALLIVHVLKTGRSRYWILILLFIPVIRSSLGRFIIRVTRVNFKDLYEYLKLYDY